MRVKAVIEYDGSKFYGFQKQNSTPYTVTTQLELALKSIKIDSSIVGSGRTDRGVHASGQVIHFDIPSFWENISKLKYVLNQKLKSIKIKHITKVDTNFHARFSAKKRVYRYIFKTSSLSVFEQNYISYYPPFDASKLHLALKLFIGQHDFALFYKTGSLTHTTIRTIYNSRYIKRGDYHYIYFEANGFLRSQVRMMVDASMQVAKGELSINELKTQIKTIHQYSTRLAPPSGLYLAKIIY